MKRKLINIAKSTIVMAVFLSRFLLLFKDVSSNIFLNTEAAKTNLLINANLYNSSKFFSNVDNTKM